MKQDKTTWKLLSAKTAKEVKSGIESLETAKELQDTKFAEVETMVKRVN